MRLAARQKHSAPKVEAFFAWSDSQLTRIAGKGDLARAFRNGLACRASFSLFLIDCRVAIDNNPAARALRPIGRSAGRIGSLRAPTSAAKRWPAQ